MRHLELEEHFGRLAIGTLISGLVICLILLGVVMVTSISPSGLIALALGVIVFLIIGYWVGKWILG